MEKRERRGEGEDRGRKGVRRREEDILVNTHPVA